MQGHSAHPTSAAAAAAHRTGARPAVEEQGCRCACSGIDGFNRLRRAAAGRNGAPAQGALWATLQE